MKLPIFISLPASFFWQIKKIDFLSLAIGALFITSFAFVLGNSYYEGKWATACAGLALIIAQNLYKKFGAASAALFFYLMLNAICIVILKNRYLHVHPYFLNQIKLFSSESAWKLALLIVPFCLVPLDFHWLQKTGRFFCYIFFAISVFRVIGEWALNGCGAMNSCGGALLNPSLNTAMLAVLLPFMPYSLAAAALVAFCAMISKSSIGIGMTAIFVGLKLAPWGRIKEPKAFIRGTALTALTVAAIFAAGYLTHGHKTFFDSTGRFGMWSFFMKMWALHRSNWVFGVGFGTFRVFSIYLQQHEVVDVGSGWLWMHNDWLQMIFECGVIGGVLTLWLYGACLQKLQKANLWPEFQSLLLFGVMMGCNYPLHIAPCCLYAAWITFLSLISIDANEALAS